MTDHVNYFFASDERHDVCISSQKDPGIIPREGESVMFKGTGTPTEQDVPRGEFIVEKVWHRVRVPDEPDDLEGTITDVYVTEADNE